MPPLTFYINPDLEKTLEAEAALRGITISKYVNLIVSMWHGKNLEAITEYDERIKRLERNIMGLQKVIAEYETKRVSI